MIIVRSDDTDLENIPEKNTGVNSELVWNDDDLVNMRPSSQRDGNGTNEIILELQEEIRLLKQSVMETKVQRETK